MKAKQIAANSAVGYAWYLRTSRARRHHGRLVAFGIKMKRVTFLVFLLMIIPLQSSLARCEDLAFLCDSNEAYFRAEEKIISNREPYWEAYAKAILAIRLEDLCFQRGELTKIQRDDRRPVKVANTGWCGLQIGDGDAFKAPAEHVEVLHEYVRRDADADSKYVELMKKWRKEIIEESGMDKAKCIAILRRYVPIAEK